MKSLFLISLLLITIFTFSSKTTNAYGECSQYGPMAMYDGFSSCTCMSGYSMGKDFSGQTSCISDYQMCQTQYGYHATSNYAGGCKCNYGYGFGKDYSGRTQCVSLDSQCSDQLGYNSSYDSVSDSCKCSYGYIIQNGQCVSGNSYCSSKQGLYSSYDSSAKQCACNSGYTLNEEGQCVEKQNNVYFTLKELDTNNKKAIIKSDYDYSYYSIQYNSGCYASSFKRYLNHQIVVNLGTDFYLDTWDKIVLQDDDETCDITHKEKVDSSFSLENEDGSGSLTFDQLTAINELDKNTPVKSQEKVVSKPKVVLNKPDTNKTKIDDSKKDEYIIMPNIDKKEDVVPEPAKKLKWYQKIFNWFKGK